MSVGERCYVQAHVAMLAAPLSPYPFRFNEFDHIRTYKRIMKITYIYIIINRERSESYDAMNNRSA